MLNVHIGDGEGTARVAGVTAQHALKVTQVSTSFRDVDVSELTRFKFYRAYLSTAAGSNDMRVPASASAPAEFFVAAQPKRAIYVTGMRLLLQDLNMELSTADFRRFGSAYVSPGLTNGLRCFAEQGGIVSDLFSQPVRALGEFLNYADSWINFVNAITAQCDYVSFDFDFDQPVVLAEGSMDRLVLQVRDTLTAMTLFQGIARGYQEII
jgi:hypothetical protein